MALVDTSALLRLVTGDMPEQAGQVAEWLEGSEPHSLLVPDAVLAEFCFILEFHPLYQFDRSVVVDLLSELLQLPALRFPAYTQSATELYRSDKKLDFTDCLVASKAETDKVAVLTFDKRLKKYL